VKFGHVTFFWNGNRSGYFDETKEEYVEIPSDSGITFNEQPKMKALEIAEKTRDAILSGKFDQVKESGNCSICLCLFASIKLLMRNICVGTY
jgi:2,3-bisphosphoglycerate-independent phosphoglycerate mutase